MESLVSTKSYCCGDVILECEPLVYGVSDDQKGRLCDQCLRWSQSLKKCSNCKQMFYCDTKCQSIDWIYHKFECKRFSRIDFKIPVIVRLSLRLNYIIKNDKTFETKSYELPNNTNICFNDIKKHSNVKQRLKSTLILKYGFDLIDKSIVEDSQIYSIIYLKSFNLETIEDNLKIKLTNVKAFSVQLSVLSHSCVPNAAIINNGLNIELRAMTQIPIGN